MVMGYEFERWDAFAMELVRKRAKAVSDLAPDRIGDGPSS